MNKVIEALYNLAEHGDDRAAAHLMKMENLGAEQLAHYVADNDTELQEILGLNTSIMSNPDEFDKSLQDAYYALRNTGVTAYTGDKKTDIYGRPMHSLDDFMSEFGISPSDEKSMSNYDRAYFTNPSHANYWKNRPENERASIARRMGYADVRELDDYLDRAAKDFQNRLDVEGNDANNEATRWWIPSAIAGLTTPRVKEAKLAGREVRGRDYLGDIAENAISVIPGFGTNKIITKVAPRLGARYASTAAAPVIGGAVDYAAQPLASQLLDAKILYNKDVAGIPEDTLNLRSEMRPEMLAAQVAGIGASKSAIKGGASMAKDFIETLYGKGAGGKAFNTVMNGLKNINDSTDDLIARRQAVLDRKAELAKQRRNVGFATDNDIPAGNANVADMQAAETFRILDSEAERLAKSEEARKAYRDAIAKDRAWATAGEKLEDAYAPLEKIGKFVPENFAVDESKYIVPNTGKGFKLLIPVGTDPDVINGAFNEARRRLDEIDRFTATPEGQQAAAAAAAAAAREGAVPEQAKVILDYVNANEASPIKGQLLELPDGNLVNSNWVTRRGDEWRVRYPGADYDVKLTGKPAPLAYQYEKTFDPGMDINELYGRNPVEGELSRNKVVRDKILHDDLLKRKLKPNTYKVWGGLRDIGANDAFNIMAREGIGGLNYTHDIQGSRERARWNSMLRKLSLLTTDPKLSVDERRRNADAIMNVMQYGLDGLPAELFGADPETYREIAGKLGVTDWKHFTEREIQPTNSSSRAD